MEPQLLSTRERPALDEMTFQQLLAAAFVLQESKQIQRPAQRGRQRDVHVGHTYSFDQIPSCKPEIGVGVSRALAPTSPLAAYAVPGGLDRVEDVGFVTA